MAQFFNATAALNQHNEQFISGSLPRAIVHSINSSIESQFITANSEQFHIQFVNIFYRDSFS